MPEYLAHASGERIRFRHQVFAREDKKLRAMELLKQMEEVAGIKPGMNSLLVFLQPEGDLKAICAILEHEFPELAKPENESARKTGNCGTSNLQKTGQRNTRKKLELQSLLVSGTATLGLAIFGFHHLHALAGGIFSLFAIQHVWQRRQRL